MREKGIHNWIKWGKYLTLGALVLFVFLSFRRAGRDAPFETVSAQVLGSLDTERMSEGDWHDLKRCYGLNGADYEGVLLYLADYGMEAEELLLVRAETSAQRDEVEAAMRQRLAGRGRDFAGYAPEAYALVEDAELVTRGQYVFLCVSPQAKEARSAFLEAFK